MPSATRRQGTRNEADGVSSNKMPYAGMSDAQERADLVAYLQLLR